ncbi:MAG: hypothetical protein K5891_05015, partial [Lachnospiraceae bacterium]|nr:hypothetical protein [Lachnospiraceae bacterium]
SVLDLANQLKDEEDYLKAIDKLDAGLEIISDDPEMTVLRGQCEALYAINVVARADALLDEKDYEGASSLLNEALAVFPGNEVLIDKANKVEESRPKYLLDIMEPFEKVYYEKSPLIMGGNTYDHGFSLHNSFESYAYFQLNGQYDTLEFDFGHVDGSAMKNATLYIILDDVTVAEISGKANGAVEHYSVNVAGGSVVQFYFPGGWGPKYGIVNVTVQ